VNRFMIEHAPSTAIENSKMAVHTHTLHTHIIHDVKTK
jgi:hypothetical protein